ncbi:hypothetical protein HK096_003423 [Nowakowskiella sp. JEL0078]|nr:hypothetical protein HK096_003423 [Nowakowskiella sp. JEL0078]
MEFDEASKPNNLSAKTPGSPESAKDKLVSSSQRKKVVSANKEATLTVPDTSQPANTTASSDSSTSELPEFATSWSCPFDYLLALDFKTTCDESYSNSNEVKVTKDSAEIIEISFAVLSTSTKTIIHRQQILVRPLHTNLIPFVSQLTGITVESLGSADTLQSAIQELDSFISANFTKNDKTFCFVTHGEWNLRYQLMRESQLKEFVLLHDYFVFFDVVKEVSIFSKLSESSETTPLVRIDIASLCSFVGIQHQGRLHNGSDDAFNIARIAEKVIDRTQKQIPRYTRDMEIRIPFSKPLDLMMNMSTFNATKSNVAHLGGLPFQAIKSDIETLVGLAGVTAKELWVGRNSDGRADGSGYAVFHSHEDAKACLSLHGRILGERTILVTPDSIESLKEARSKITSFPVFDFSNIHLFFLINHIYKKIYPEPLPSHPELKHGDWLCVACQFHNFASRKTCLKCGLNSSSASPSPSSPSLSSNGMRPGDWICPNQRCKFQNFASRNECLRCKERRPSSATGLSTSTLNKSSTNAKFLPGDWVCSHCGVNNFAARTRCVQCGAPDSHSSNRDTTNNSRSRPTDRPGDWGCPNEACRYHNYASRQECHRCGARRISSAPVQNPPPPVQHISVKPGDWVCTSCSFHNFAKRDTCASCGISSNMANHSGFMAYQQQFQGYPQFIQPQPIPQFNPMFAGYQQPFVGGYPVIQPPAALYPMQQQPPLGPYYPQYPQ